MAQTSVSSSILAIIASFSSGLNVVKRLREKRKSRNTRSKQNARDGGEELRLSRSLQKGPEDIGWEYQTYSQQFGDRYAVGDGMETLLEYYCTMVV